MKKTNFFTLQTKNTPLHYMPEEEEHMHAIDRFDCKCNPRLKEKNNTLIILHTPFNKKIKPFEWFD